MMELRAMMVTVIYSYLRDWITIRVNETPTLGISHQITTTSQQFFFPSQDLKAVRLTTVCGMICIVDVVIAGTLTVQLPSLCDTYSHLSTINNQEHCFIA